MILARALLTLLLHVGLMLAAAPTLAGIANGFDAWLRGRTAPPLLQPWRDLVRLSRKTPAVPDDVSVVARIAPALACGAMLAVAALVPSFTLGMAMSHIADLVVIVAMLSLSRVATALAALDSGAARPGLAIQTASARAVLAEPAMMLVCVSLALMAGSFNIDRIVLQQREGVLLPAAASAVALTAVVALLLVDHDDPAIAEGFAGTDLALMRYTAWLRRVVWIDLIGCLFLPIGIASVDQTPLAWLIGLLAWAVKLIGFTAALSALHALAGRVPRQGVPGLIGVAALLALLAMIMVMTSGGSA